MTGGDTPTANNLSPDRLDPLLSFLSDNFTEWKGNLGEDHNSSAVRQRLQESAAEAKREEEELRNVSKKDEPDEVS